MSKEISNEEALQNLLLDIDCLDELLPWTVNLTFLMC